MPERQEKRDPQSVISEQRSTNPIPNPRVPNQKTTTNQHKYLPMLQFMLLF
ncbi:hypothetical protein [Oscillatoria salina]|uniref:hypothetical protein n=1 Tax=Oscillatoria salina TaxID=331517 RepID=UPI001CCC55C0|nr:hypothetical protein [Oscillatoria salina]MBZ8181997.1 hypothetical protein [Oscillatoria salina IIICB1]